MIIISIILGTGIIVVASIYWIGHALPEAHTASQSQHFMKSPTQVWAMITGYGDYPQWRKNLESTEILPEKEGYLSWRENGGRNDGITFIEIEKQIPERLVVQIDDTGLPFGGRWIYELDAENGGTILTITEEGKVYNPIYRFVSHFFLSQTQSMQDYLASLDEHLR